MVALQVKAFLLLLIVLLVVDAVGFHGQYRDLVGAKLGSFAAAISPTHWNGMGGGRDWATPGPHR